MICRACARCQETTRAAAEKGPENSRDEDFRLYPNPECDGWMTCNCVCQESLRARYHRLSRRPLPQPKPAPDLTEPMFELP